VGVNIASAPMNSKSKILLGLALLSVIGLNFHQYQVNLGLEREISAAQKAAAQRAAAGRIAATPKPPIKVVAQTGTVITPGGGTEEISLAILQARGIPTKLRKVGNKFYPLTVDDIRNDPDLMKQLKSRVISMPGQMYTKLKGYGLSSEVVQGISSAIGDRNAKTYLLYLDYLHPGLDADDLAAFDAERRSIYDDADTKIGALFRNADDFADFKASVNQYEASQQPLQAFTLNLKRSASTAGEDLSLTPEQNDTLLRIIQDELAASNLPDPFEASLMQGTGMATVVPDIFQAKQMKDTGTDTTAFADEKKAVLAHVMDRAAQVLSPAQFAVFQQQPPDMMAIQMQSKATQFLNMSVMPYSDGGPAISGQLTIIPAYTSGFGMGSDLSYSVKALPAAP